MSKSLRITLVILSCLLPCLRAAAAAADDRSAAKEFVESAASFLATAGKERGLAELAKKDGKFVKGELYVFAYDMEGTMAAHPINPKLVGKNLLDVPDVDGKFFRKDIVELAKTRGSGWVDYKYKNPDTNKIERKTTYIKKVGDLILCCGVYQS